MPDGSKWDVPVAVIANHRAKHYAHEFQGNVKDSLTCDTNILFSSDPFEIEDWAANNMNWSDVYRFAVKASDGEDVVDYQDGWVNGEKELL
jgi:hypothetical protein